MGGKYFHEMARQRATVLAPALAALILTACASDAGPERASMARAQAADHATAGYLPRDMGAAERAVLASLGREETPGFRYAAALSSRASIGAEADPASAAHEAEFAKAGPQDDPGKLRNASSPAPRAVLVQNQMAPDGAADGGWRETSDAFIHDYSGMRCPKELKMLLQGETEEAVESLMVGLTRITVYDEAGQDTSCDYQDAPTGIYYTLYASNWPQTTREEHFGSALNAIANVIPLQEAAPVLVAEAKVDRPSTIEGETLGAAFLTQPVNGVTYKTALWLNKTGPWHVKARATFPADLAKGEGAISLVEMVAVTVHTITLVEVDEYINAAQTVSFSGR